MMVRFAEALITGVTLLAASSGGPIFSFATWG